MELRKLQKCDIDGMLEWMHDDDINRFFRFHAADTTKEQAEIFIENSFTKENRHYAVVDEKNQYLGTISLKNINLEDRNAEYAISIRKGAWGKGVSAEATKKVLEIAFEELKLQKVYLNVLSENGRAVKFYEKAGFTYIGESKNHVMIKGEFYDLKWFEIQRGDKF